MPVSVEERAVTSRESIQQVILSMQQSVLGQERVIERLMIALLTNGNVLVEGLPGTAKTRSIKTLAAVLEADLSRIQFTPDLLPSDVTGTEMLHTGADGRQALEFQQGPIFANLVLADEINRSPAKVQAALLEAMEERQVTVAGVTHTLPDLFMVLATQNPIEQEGTYPLPEAQMDRFIMKVYIHYPDEDTERRIMKLVRGEDQGGGRKEEVKVAQQAVFAAREEVLGLRVSEGIENYIVALVGATRDPGRYGEELGKWIDVGSSPRATLSLDRCARAHAWLHGNEHVTPDNVREVAHDVLRHRIILSYEANADGITTDEVITEILKQVAVA